MLISVLSLLVMMQSPADIKPAQPATPVPATDASSQPPAAPEDFPGLDAISTRRNWTAPGEASTFNPADHINLVGVAKACSETLARAQWRQDIVLQVNSTAHFDNCAFDGGLEYIESLIDLIDKLDLASHPEKATDAADLAGRALHGIQDFYAHTNYVELMASGGQSFDDQLVLPVWTEDGRAAVRKLAKKKLVSGRVSWDWPKQCAADVPTHAQLAKDSGELPAGRARVGPWKRTAYRAALELADQATRQFLRYAYSRWPALKTTCGPVVVYLPMMDRRADPGEPTASRMPSSLPACRLDPHMTPIVTTTLQHVLDAAGRQGYAVPGKILVNPETSQSGVLSLQLVLGLPVGVAGADGCPREGAQPSLPLTFDGYTIRGLCEAVSSDPALIRCSGDEILAISSKDQWNGRPSAALAYIFAHELSHVLHADRSHFSAASRVIDLASTTDEKHRFLYEMCEGSDASREADRKQEQRADDEALAIVRDLIQRSPYRDLRALKGAAVTENAFSLERASSSAHQWLRSIGEDAPLPRRLLSADLPATEESARNIARGLLCDIDQSKKGWITLPISRHGTHPSEVDRLAHAHAALAALGEGVPAIQGTATEQSEQMLAALETFQEQTSAQTAELYATVGRCLCEDVDADRTVLCKGVTIVPPDADVQPEPRSLR